MESEGLGYEKTEKGYAVTGMGDCRDSKIVIPETYLGLPVLGVADGAFAYEKKLREVTLPEGLKYVGDWAFDGCDCLEILRLPAGMEKVGAYPVPRTRKNFAVEISGEALASYEERAEQGDGEAAYVLYVFGLSSDRKGARLLLEKAAKLGSPAALYTLASEAYGEGDARGAGKKYFSAARRKYAPAMKRLGDLALRGSEGGVPDYKRAAGWYESAAKEGNAGAAVGLGKLCEKGLGVPCDLARARKLYAAAAKKKDAEGAYLLGKCLLSGVGGEKDEEGALRRFLEAANLGSTAALREAGRCYKDGVGTEKAPEKAAKLFKKAALDFDPESAFLLGCMFYEGDGVRQCFSEAARWFSRAAESLPRNLKLEFLTTDGATYVFDAVREYGPAATEGDAESLYNLGACLFHGRGVRRDAAKAAVCFRESALKGFPLGENAYARCLYEGTGVEKNPNDAEKFFRRASKKGIPAAEYGLAECLLKNRRGEEDIREAEDLLESAAKAGYVSAMLKLGLMRTDENEPRKAARFFTEAALAGSSDGQLLLSALHKRGEGVEKNEETAAKLCKSAAEACLLHRYVVQEL